MVNTSVDVPNIDGKRTTYSLEISITNSYTKLTSDQAFTFTAQEALSRNIRKERTVFKGELVDRAGNPCPKPIVCKLVRGDTSSL